jgi:hypothetical protein
VAANHEALGYKVFFLFNAEIKQYLKCLKHFLENATEYLTCYFSGHGTNLNHFMFVEGSLDTQTLVTYLKSYSKGFAKTLLMNDCCHSESIWDIPTDPVKALEFPANIVSASASLDDESAKQGTVGGDSQGLFTYYFCKNVKENPGIPLRKLQPLINQCVSSYNQHCIMIATRPVVLETPFFVNTQ